MTFLKELGVRITAHSADLDQELRKTETKLKSVGRRLEGIGRDLSARITLPLLAVGGAALKMASDAEESENLFDVSLGKMADAGRTFSDQLSDALGLNAIAVRKNIGVFQSMFSAMSIGEEAAFSMSTTLSQLAVDLGSLFDVDPGEAFEKLQSGIAGQSRPLQEWGILVNEASISQTALRHGLIQSGEAMSQVQKVMARYLTIIESATLAQGDAARTNESIANLTRRAKNSFIEAGQALGAILIPAFGSVLKVGISFLETLRQTINWLGKAPQPLQLAALGLVALAAAAGPLILYLGALAKAWALVQSALVVGKVLLLGQAAAFGPLVLAIGAVGAAGFLLAKNWRTAQTLWAEVWMGFLITAQHSIDALLDAIEPVSRAIPGLFDGFDGLRDRVGEKFTTAIRASGQELAKLRRELSAAAAEEGPKLNPADFEIDVDEMLAKLRSAFESAGGTEGGGASMAAKFLSNLQAALEAAESRSTLLGDSYNVAAAKAQAYQKALDALIDSGVDPTSDAIAELQQKIQMLSEAAARQDAWLAYSAAIADAEQRSRLFGEELDMTAVRVDALRDRIRTLTAAGISEQDDELAGLIRQYQNLNEQLKVNAALEGVGENVSASLNTAEVVSGFEEMQAAAGRMAEGMGRFFEDVILGTKGLVGAFAAMVDGVLRELTRLFVQDTIVGPLAGLLSPGGSSVVGGGGSSVVGGGETGLNLAVSRIQPLAITAPAFEAPTVTPPAFSMADRATSRSYAAAQNQSDGAGRGGETIIVEAPVHISISALDMRGVQNVAQQVGHMAAEMVFEKVENSLTYRARILGHG